MDRCFFAVCALWIVALMALPLAAALAQTHAGGPPFPSLANGVFYPSYAEAEAACRGDMPWQKAQLEKEESGPHTRWQVIEQHCEFRTAANTGMPANHFTLVNRIIETVTRPGNKPGYRTSERNIERMTFMVVKPVSRKKS